MDYGLIAEGYCTVVFGGQCTAAADPELAKKLYRFGPAFVLSEKDLKEEDGFEEVHLGK
jgi:hypothetical protein